MTFDELMLNVKVFEGFRPRRYLDAGGVETLGYGFTASCFANGVVPATITKEKADELLEVKLVEVSKNVSKTLYDLGYSTADHDALLLPLTDFTFNCGRGNLLTLLQNGRRTVAQICSYILLYDKCNGKPLKGLTNRRTWERDEILKGMKAQGTPVKEYTVNELQKILVNTYHKDLVIDGIIGKNTLKACIDVLEQGC